ncbi:hypothetical protein LMG27198_08110 [Methylocystis echinoides]|jgi:hypothetical protein|uniref:Lipoprotein n=1 Tax=Methylocystis echinoides TaxID=29468 RepID=A0A9W6GRZ6_9HYPH|nr:hypothetical protein LMG27198_08110 [Methylocystis echinoides]
MFRPRFAFGRAQDSGERMKSRLAAIVALCGLALALSACDKCGGFQEIRVPGMPHACKDATAR